MIWLILGVGLVWRLINLNQSLWLDEAITAQAIKNSSFWQLVVEFPKFDLHPPGHYLVLWLWSQLFGSSEVALRSLSVLFGLITIYLVWLIGKKIFSPAVGLWAAVLLAMNPLHLYYSQETRMYAMATMAVTLNFYFFIRLLKGHDKWGYGLSAMLVMISDYVAYFSFLGQLVVLICWYRTSLKGWLIRLVPGGLLFASWLPIFLAQLQTGTGSAANLPVWQKVVGGFEVKSLALTGVKFMLGRISFDNKYIYAGVVLAAGVMHGAIIVKAWLKEQEWVQVLLVMVGVPIGVAWLGSLVLPIFSYFRVLFCLPMLMLILAVGVVGWQKWGKVVGVMIGLVYLICGAIYLINPQFQREDWKGLINYLGDQPQAVVLLESNGPFAPYQYYDRGQITTVPALTGFPANSKSDLQNLAPLIDNRRVYLVEYLVEISDNQRLVQQELTDLGYEEVGIKNFNGVGFVREYKK